MVLKKIAQEAYDFGTIILSGGLFLCQEMR